MSPGERPAPDLPSPTGAPSGGATRALPPGPIPDPVPVEGALPLERIFNESEAALVQRLRTYAAPGTMACQLELARAMARGLRSLAPMALALDSFPRLTDRDVLAGKARSYETLIQTLVEAGEHGLEWVLPSKAVVARAFGITKVNFFTALSYAIAEAPDAEASELKQAIADAVEEAVYARLAEELYASFVTSRTTDRDVKALAAQQLIPMWEGRLGLATTRFCPLLRSAWAARMRAPRVFGTLMGAHEIVRLLFEDCDAQFVTWFGGHEYDSEQRQAFEEFLFDLPFESLETVRQRMKEDGKSCVGPHEVEAYLGFGVGRLRPLVGDPKGLYSSFRRRRVKAQYRTSMRVPGPKRTAEAYVLEALLREGAPAPGGG